MVNEASGENLLDFSKKMLDEAFGPNEESLLTKIEDPSKGKIVQTSTNGLSLTTSEPEIEPQSESEIVTANVPSQEETVEKQTSSDLATSLKDNTSDDIKDISTDSTEDSTELSRSSGFKEMTLKRKSMMGTEEENDPDSQLHIETDNPSHLFWVPAHLHPEIAPNEFRKWLKNHAKDGFNSGVNALRRRKSALSKQYIPSDADDDDIEEKTDKKLETAKFDWESYADENINPTSESTKLNILRRSLSLNLPPFMGGSIASPNDPNVFDRHSSPDVGSEVLVPRMSPALKRTARTKIRRNSVAGDENPRRFSAHRRTRSTHISSGKDKQSEDNVAKTHKQKSESLVVPNIIDRADMNIIDDNPKIILVDEPSEILKEKDIELDCIDVNDDAGPIRITLKDEVPDKLKIDLEPSPDKSDLLKVNTSEVVGNASNTTSPSTSPTSSGPTSPTTVTPKRTTWSWLWSGGSEEKSKDKEKDGEKDKEEKESKTKKNKSSKSDKNDNENNDKEKEKEKSPRKSFTSIFSWQNKGKSTDDSSSSTNTTSLSLPIISNKKTKYTNYNRLPIHVERAIYRLSHVKLANPRRPLHEQVLISNMMFWYLSLINKQQTEFGGSGNPNAEIAAAQVKSKVGKEKTGRKRKKAEKKSGLTRKGAGPGSSTEMAFKAPQYNMNQVSQYMTPKLATPSNEFEEETLEDYGDHSEEEFRGHSYHHYNDEYLSDGTDGGYLDETNGKIESSHGGGLLHTSAEFDDNIGESSSETKNKKKYSRSPSPNGRSKSPTGRPTSPTGRPTSPNGRSTSPTPPTPQRNSVPPSNKRKLINIPRNRSSSAGTKSSNSKITSKMSMVNSTADDEDDDVPLGGLYKISSNK